MTVYRIRILNAATRDLAKLDKPVGRRIAERIRWLAEDLDDVHPEALTGDLSGFYKFRVGGYRILYETLEDEQTIVIHAIDHRSRIYRKR